MTKESLNWITEVQEGRAVVLPVGYTRMKHDFGAYTGWTHNVQKYPDGIAVTVQYEYPEGPLYQKPETRRFFLRSLDTTQHPTPDRDGLIAKLEAAMLPAKFDFPDGFFNKGLDKAVEIIRKHYGSGAVQSAAERHSLGAEAPNSTNPAQEGDALIPESAPATSDVCIECSTLREGLHFLATFGFGVPAVVDGEEVPEKWQKLIAEHNDQIAAHAAETLAKAGSGCSENTDEGEKE